MRIKNKTLIILSIICIILFSVYTYMVSKTVKEIEYYMNQMENDLIQMNMMLDEMIEYYDIEIWLFFI